MRMKNIKHNRLNSARNAYLIGIKGVGMCALAQILKSRGVRVLGSDTYEKFFTDEVLKKLKIECKEGFAKKNLPKNIDVIIASNAYINTQNPEIAEADRRGVSVISYPDALAELFNNAYGIAIAGSHGKSTTTAMLGYILEYVGMDPTVIVGSRVNQWGSNARASRQNLKSLNSPTNGAHHYFVAEADEYRDAFLKYRPKMIVLTNIDYDHPDYFKTEAAYKKSFQKFMRRVPKDKLIDGRQAELTQKFDLKLKGEHNQQNATVAYLAARKLGVKADTAKEALRRFSGLSRRFESYGSYHGALLYDDYAHHPTEIRAAINGAKQTHPDRKIIVMFQAHTFTRTKKLFDDFNTALKSADEVYILKTYSSARERGEDIWGKKLAKALNTRYFTTHKAAANYLHKNQNYTGSTCVVLALGAGDGWQVLTLLKNIK